jgi:hypothetical protein
MNNNELSSSHAGGSVNQEDFDTSSINEILMAGDKSKGGRPYFFNDPMVEKVLNITMSVATELAVARERIDTLERILVKNGLLDRKDIESYEPDEDSAQERQLWHAKYASRILRIVQQDIDAVANPQNNKDMHQIADDINEM